MFAFNSFVEQAFTDIPVTFLVSINESGNAISSTTQNMFTNISLNEIGNALDTNSENIIASLLINEIGNALDTNSANIIASLLIDESATLINMVLIYDTAILSVNELVEAQDITNNTRYVAVALIENGNATDIYYSYPIFNNSDMVWHVLPRNTVWNVS